MRQFDEASNFDAETAASTWRRRLERNICAAFLAFAVRLG
jgi:hypothetical protein